MPGRMLPGYCVVAPGGGFAEARLMLMRWLASGVAGKFLQGALGAKGAPV